MEEHPYEIKAIKFSLNFKFDEDGKKFSHKGKKTLWEKEKLLVTSNFSFSHNVFQKQSVEIKAINSSLNGKI